MAEIGFATPFGGGVRWALSIIAAQRLPFLFPHAWMNPFDSSSANPLPREASFKRRSLVLAA
jgi:hypothetical protein